MLNEAKLLKKENFSDEKLINFGIGYKKLMDYLNWKYSFEKIIDLIK